MVNAAGMRDDDQSNDLRFTRLDYLSWRVVSRLARNRPASRRRCEPQQLRVVVVPRGVWRGAAEPQQQDQSDDLGEDVPEQERLTHE